MGWNIRQVELHTYLGWNGMYVDFHGQTSELLLPLITSETEPRNRSPKGFLDLFQRQTVVTHLFQGRIKKRPQNCQYGSRGAGVCIPERFDRFAHVYVRT